MKKLMIALMMCFTFGSVAHADIQSLMLGKKGIDVTEETLADTLSKIEKATGKEDLTKKQRIMVMLMLKSGKLNKETLDDEAKLKEWADVALDEKSRFGMAVERAMARDAMRDEEQKKMAEENKKEMMEPKVEVKTVDVMPAEDLAAKKEEMKKAKELKDAEEAKGKVEMKAKKEDTVADKPAVEEYTAETKTVPLPEEDKKPVNEEIAPAPMPTAAAPAEPEIKE